MDEDAGSSCDMNINSPVSLKVSRRDLVRLRDRIGYLESSLRELEESQTAAQKMISRMIRDTEGLASIFDSLFGEEVAAFRETGSGAEKLTPTSSPELITLAPDRVAREKIISVMDAIRRASEESGGAAPKDDVRARAKEIGIDREEFSEILSQLRKGGALLESADTLKLI